MAGMLYICATPIGNLEDITNVDGEYIYIEKQEKINLMLKNIRMSLQNGKMNQKEKGGMHYSLKIMIKEDHLGDLILVWIMNIKISHQRCLLQLTF